MEKGQEESKKIINTKNSFEVFFVDLDGTFYDKRFSASQKNITAAFETNLKNVPVVFVTGRGLDQGVVKVLTQVKSPYFVGLNGAHIYKLEHIPNLPMKTQQIFSCNIQQSIGEKIVDYCTRERLYFSFNSTKIVYGQVWKLPQSFFVKTVINRRVKSYKKLQEPAEFLKFSILTITRKSHEKLLSFLRGFELNIYVTFGGYLVEVGAPECSKGSSIQKVAKILGKNLKNCVHIGNDLNDATVVNKIGWLMAVADARASILRIANLIGPKHTKGGVAKILSGIEVEPKKPCYEIEEEVV